MLYISDIITYKMSNSFVFPVGFVIPSNPECFTPAKDTEVYKIARLTVGYPDDPGRYTTKPYFYGIDIDFQPIECEVATGLFKFLPQRPPNYVLIGPDRYLDEKVHEGQLCFDTNINHWILRRRVVLISPWSSNGWSLDNSKKTITSAVFMINPWHRNQFNPHIVLPKS